MTEGSPTERRTARRATPDLLVLARWEEFCAWFLAHTGRWPKHARFTHGQRVQNHALDIAEMLTVARYDRNARPELLAQVNLLLERLRLLLRLARESGVMPHRGFETAARGIDETGRMLHGWRRAVGERKKTTW